MGLISASTNGFYRQAIVIIMFVLLGMGAVACYSSLAGYDVSSDQKEQDIPWWGGAIVWYWNMPIDMDWIAGIHPRPNYALLDPDTGVLDNPWTKNDLEKIKATGIKVIGYLNIGFAEEWRDYWDPSWSKDNHPEWLFWTEYPGWEGEHFVKYWHPSAWKPGGWIDILKNEVKKIVELGFDGIILDNIDSYTAWENPSDWGLENLLPQVKNASTWMIYLVGNITAYARSLKPDIIIIANMGGGLPLLYNDTFLSSIDAILEEEVWYSEDELLSPEDTEWAIKYLDYAIKHDIDVIILDYAWTKDNVLDDIKKAISKSYYIYVASTYELNTLAPYVPSYSGLAYTSEPNPIIVWSYHGITGDTWLNGFDVYVAHISDNYTLANIVRISSNNSDDVFPSIAYSDDKDKLLIVWQTDQGSHEELEVDKHWWIKGVFLEPDTLNVINEIKIEADKNHSLLYPSIAYYNGLFYVFYASGSLEDIECRDIYYTVIDPDSGEVGKARALTTDSNFNDYPRTVVTPNGIAVVWSSNDGLYLSLINENGAKWKICVDKNVEPQRYTVLYVDSLGIVVLYQKSSSTYMKVYNLEGKILKEEQGLPAITWSPYAIHIGNYIVYTGLNNIVFLKYNGEKVEKSVLNTHTDVSGVILGYDPNKGFLAIYRPGSNGNNTLDIETIPVINTTVTKTQTITSTLTHTVTKTTLETKTETFTITKTESSVIPSVTTSVVKETDWDTTIVVALILLVVGLLTGIFIKKQK